MKLLAVLLIVAVFTAQAALPALIGLKTVTSLNGWRPIQRGDLKNTVSVGFQVKQNNMDTIEKLFWEVSNPQSENYGQYLSHEEIGKLVANPEATSAVMSFLENAGLEPSHVNTHGEYVEAEIPMSLAEELFDATFTVYVSSFHAFNITKTTSYTIPEALLEHITHISHMSHFPAPISQPMFSTRGPSSVDPDNLLKYYGVSDASVKSSQTTQSIFGGLGQSFSQADLATFQKNYRIDANPISKVIGPNSEGKCSSNVNACGEASLDVQYITAVAQGADTWFWSMKRFDRDMFNTWATAVANDPNPPLVHSISYGGFEVDTDGMTAFNKEMMKLGLRGVSVMVSSGDDGVANFQARNDASQCAYNPSFPASSPYVTAVGATQGVEDNIEEIAESSDAGGLITTGGGFSTFFDTPSYQQANVDAFFNNVSPAPKDGYNRAGRGLPDVSLAGHNFVVVVGGQELVVSGTSASSPAFAGMVSLVNDARLRSGKPALGFLNPALYQLDSGVWNDITSGRNYCAAGQSMRNIICCDEGFTATTGWDPLTGLGSPNFPKFKDALEAL